MADETHSSWVEDVTAEVLDDVGGTPTVFVNGEPVDFVQVDTDGDGVPDTTDYLGPLNAAVEAARA